MTFILAALPVLQEVSLTKIRCRGTSHFVVIYQCEENDEKIKPTTENKVDALLKFNSFIFTRSRSITNAGN